MRDLRHIGRSAARQAQVTGSSVKNNRLADQPRPWQGFKKRSRRPIAPVEPLQPAVAAHVIDRWLHPRSRKRARQLRDGRRQRAAALASERIHHHFRRGTGRVHNQQSAQGREALVCVRHRSAQGAPLRALGLSGSAQAALRHSGENPQIRHARDRGRHRGAGEEQAVQRVSAHLRRSSHDRVHHRLSAADRRRQSRPA